MISFNEEKTKDSEEEKKRIAFNIAQTEQNLNNQQKTLKTYEKELSELISSLENEEKALSQLGLKKFSIEYHSESKKQQLIIGMTLAEGIDLLVLSESTNEYELKNPYLSSMQNMLIARNMVREINDLHQQGMLHRDIKPMNFILNPRTCDVTLIDHGASQSLNGSEEIKSDVLIGTPAFSALELRNKTKDFSYTKKSDAYCLGISIALFFDLVEQKDTNSPLLLVDESHKKFLQNDRLPNDPAIKKEILELVKNMTDNIVDKRLSVNEAKEKLDAILEKMKQDKKIKTIVGVFHVDHYCNLDPQEKETYLLDIVNQFKKKYVNAIAFADNTIRDQNIYIEIQSLFAKQGIFNFSPTIFIDDKNVIQSKIIDDFKQNIPGHIEFVKTKDQREKIELLDGQLKWVNDLMEQVQKTMLPKIRDKRKTGIAGFLKNFLIDENKIEQSSSIFGSKFDQDLLNHLLDSNNNKMTLSAFRKTQIEKYDAFLSLCQNLKTLKDSLESLKENLPEDNDPTFAQNYRGSQEKICLLFLDLIDKSDRNLTISFFGARKDGSALAAQKIINNTAFFSKEMVTGTKKELKKNTTKDQTESNFLNFITSRFRKR